MAWPVATRKLQNTAILGPGTPQVTSSTSSSAAGASAAAYDELLVLLKARTDTVMCAPQAIMLLLVQ